MVQSLRRGFPVQRGEGSDVVDSPGGKLSHDVVEVFAQIRLSSPSGEQINKSGGSPSCFDENARMDG